MEIFDSLEMINVDDVKILEFLTKLKDLIVPVYFSASSAKVQGLHNEPPEIKSEAKGLGLNKKVKSVICLEGSVTIPSNRGREFNYDLFEAIEFGVAVYVLNTDTKTLIYFASIQLPVSWRRKGIYTQMIKTIKSFMVENKLGNIIGLSDSSDEGTTSEVAMRHGLLCDPFLLQHEDLEEL